MMPAAFWLGQDFYQPNAELAAHLEWFGTVSALASRQPFGAKPLDP
jgi:hypothetical protein